MTTATLDYSLANAEIALKFAERWQAACLAAVGKRADARPEDPGKFKRMVGFGRVCLWLYLREKDGRPNPNMTRVADYFDISTAGATGLSDAGEAVNLTNTDRGTVGLDRRRSVMSLTEGGRKMVEAALKF